MTYCTKCGSEVKEATRFCENCGHDIKTISKKSNEEKFSGHTGRNNLEQTQSFVKRKKIVTLLVFLLPILIITSLYLLLKEDTGEHTAVALAKGRAATLISSSYFIPPTDLNISYTDVEVDLVRDETKTEAGLYKVFVKVDWIDSESVTLHEEFTIEINFQKGAYWVGW